MKRREEKSRAEKPADKASVKAAAKAKKEYERRIASQRREEAKKARLVREREHARLAAARRERRRKVYTVVRKKLSNSPSGFCYRNYGFFPRVKLICRGDGTSAMYKLSSVGIKVSDFSREGGFFSFKIRKKDMRKAVAILDEMCYNYQIGESYGFGRTLAFCAARAGLFVGGALAVLVANILYGYVWRVEISGNSLVSRAAIESALESGGFAAGMRKRDCNASAVAAAVNSLDGVADAASEIVGTTLYVYVLEAKEHESHGAFAGFVSEYDAVVTRVVLRSGTALVSRGDVVKRGDMLASGEVYSSTGELLFVSDCDAEIYGKVSLSFGADVGTTAIEYRRTGKSERRTVFDFFGFSLGKSASSFASYEYVSHRSAYDTLLPLYVTSYEYFETEPYEVERDIEGSVREFAEAKAEELRISGDFSFEHTVKPLGAGLYRINVFLTGEALISRGIDGSA